MKLQLRRYLLFLSAIVLSLLGCTNGKEDNTKKTRAPQPSDTLYTVEKALEVYDYQPGQALRILDSALVVGNASPVQADFFRARIYAWTVMGAQVDSLLHGPESVRYDSARVIVERLLELDSLKNNLPMQQDFLEVLVCVARQQQDTARFLRRSQQLVDVCHAQGAETEALRTEAEVGAALYTMGKHAQGLARIDSVINLLNEKDAEADSSFLEPCSSFKFNELDATIIALKRKIVMLSSEEKYIETIPLARSIIDRLNDYEQHPETYHDGTYREPTDSTTRADYIEFYRTQAQSAITAAYAFLGQQSNMNEAYGHIEHSVREATAREHIARYNALAEQMRRQEAESHDRQMTLIATLSAIGLLIIILFTTYIYLQKRRIQQKNRALVRLIDDGLPSSPTPKGEESSTTDAAESPTPAETDEEIHLFNTIDTQIRSERLYADPNIQRQDICDRFSIRRDVLTRLLADHAHAQSFPAYINGIRLAEACRLLKEYPDQTVNAIAEEVGFAPRNLRRLFAEHYGITPTEYRQGLKQG